MYRASPGPASRNSTSIHDTMSWLRARKRVFRTLQSAARIFRKRTSIPVQGRTFIAPVLDGQAVKITEPWMGQLLKQLVQPGAGAFVDVGVNMGQTLLALRASHDVPYLGVEPNPACVYYVRELISCNRLQDCVLFPTGLGETNEVRHLFTRQLFDACATVVNGFRSNTDSQPVTVFRGDDLLKTYQGAIQLIKVDVENGELEALLGLENTLRRHAPYVLCEILPVYDEHTDLGQRRIERQSRLLHYMRSLGYRVLRVQTDGQFLPIHEIGVHSDLALTNYIFVPASRSLQVA